LSRQQSSYRFVFTSRRGRCDFQDRQSGRPINERTDLFAVGVITFEMLTGRRPFTGQTVPALLRRVVEDELHLLEKVPQSVDLNLFCGGLWRKIPRTALDRPNNCATNSSQPFAIVRRSSLQFPLAHQCFDASGAHGAILAVPECNPSKGRIGARKADCRAALLPRSGARRRGSVCVVKGLAFPGRPEDVPVCLSIVRSVSTVIAKFVHVGGLNARHMICASLANPTHVRPQETTSRP
jgi:serine/threonine protein kinase